MLNFLLKILIIVLLPLLIVVGLNYFLDPAKLFAKSYEKEIVDILINGNNATNIVNYDERRFQEDFIHNKEKQDIIILGSSRTLLIRDEFYINKTLLNNSVSGASIEDIIAIYQIHKLNKSLPDKIYIGIDPWLFNDMNNQNRWHSISKYYHLFTGNYLRNSESNSKKFFELFSLSYFQESIKSIPQVLINGFHPLKTDSRSNKNNTKLIDGSLVYGETYRNATNKEIDDKAKIYIEDQIYSIESFQNLSEKIMNEFELLIEDMRKSDVKIVFVLVPYHPMVFDKIKSEEKYINVLLSENYIMQFSREHNINVLGTFNPYAINFYEFDFYDGMHCTEKGINKILSFE